MPAKTIYLDQMKWIDLSRAHHKRQGGAPYEDILKNLEVAVATDSVILPLATSHFIETAKHGDSSARQRLASTMVQFGKGWTIAPQSSFFRPEVRNALRSVLKLEKTSEPPQPFGRGVGFAFGEPERVTDSSIAWCRADRFPEAMMIANVRTTLTSPFESMRKRGISGVESIANSFVNRVESVRSKLKGYSPTVQRNHYYAELTYQHQTDLRLALDSAGISLSDFLDAGRGKLVEFWQSVPTMDTETELVVSRNRHWDRPVEANDTRDIAFLSVAVPYCDIVVTEKFWVAVAEQTGLAKKYNTTMLANLADLSESIVS